MSSREKILSTVGANQPAPRELPPLASGVAAASQGAAAASQGSAAAAPQGSASSAGLASQFVGVLESIGGVVYTVSDFGSIGTILHELFATARRVVSGCPELVSSGKPVVGDEDSHTLDNVDLAILPAHFGVAENGACWITEAQMLHRALPFITQHLALVIQRRDIVADMHQAYDRIAVLESAAATPYGFATFIAGPSKTADIEQSLVLGAHGPMSLTVFLLDEQLSDAGFY